ncbi:MAG: tRNA epoxyqueuosine(34) reductase QueG [Deltaproteobacteria bacterium]|nr:tRNA epoxyqueuosine(34) reductase QueG [Deltaproteobacteria bacterium]
METGTKEKVKKILSESGFDLSGVAPPEIFPHGDFFDGYLASGFHAGMDYLAGTKAERMDPKKFFPRVKSIICCAVSYNFHHDDETAEGEAMISRYANRRDYHFVLKEMLNKAAARIDGESKTCVDTGAVFEKWHSRGAGLGFIGKNTLLINRRFGSWMFPGVILSSLEIEPDEPDDADGCGDCPLCIEACPTGAITAPRVIDSRRCIAYLNNDNRGEIPAEFRGKLSGRLFGCDICQEVCPYNKNAGLSGCAALKPLFKRDSFQKQDILAMTETGFRSAFKETPVARRGLERLKYTASLLQG